MFYKSTSLPATSTHHSLFCKFGSDPCLVIQRSNRIQVWTPSMDFITELPIQGRIRSLGKISNKFDYLVVLAHQLSIAHFDHQFKNDYVITIQDQGARASEIQWMGISNEFILIHQTVGLMKVIPYKFSGSKLVVDTAFNIRLDRLDILDFIVTDNLYVLYRKNRERFVTCFQVAKQGLEAQSDFKVEKEAYKLMDLEGGIGVISSGNVCKYVVQGGQVNTQVGCEPMIVSSVCKIDTSRHLLGSDLGLFLLYDTGSSLSLSSLSKQYKQITTLSYLYNGNVFCGSHFSDSVVVDLKHVQEVLRMESTSPITDFVILPSENETTIVTCSGYNESGSLKIVTNGVGIDHLLELGLVAKGVYRLGNEVVVGGLESSWRLGPDFDVVEELDGSVIGTDIVGEYQVVVTGTTVRFMNSRENKLVTLNDVISLVNSEMVEIVNGMGGEVEFGKVCFSDQYVFLSLLDSILILQDAQVIHSFAAKSEVSCVGLENDLIVVGLWSMELVIYTFEGHELASLPLHQLPRSIQGLVVGFGDGSLVSYSYSPDHGLKQTKLTKLGTQPLHLVKSKLMGNDILMASGERVWIIDDAQKNVNVSGVHGPTAIVDDVLVYVTESVKFGKMENTEKLHVKSVRLGETVRRLCKAGNYMVCLCSKPEKVTVYGDSLPGAFGKGKMTVDYREKGRIRLLSLDGFEVLDTVELQDYEMASCVTTASFDQEFLVVGTSFDNEEGEPEKGRVLVFSIVSDKLYLCYEMETNGCVYSALGYRDKLLLTIQNRVCLYNWTGESTEDSDDMTGIAETDATNTLNLISTHYGHILALQLSLDGEDILVADLMKSVSVLRFDESTQKLVERYRDPENHWMTSAEILNGEIVGFDASFNAFVVQQPENGSKLEWTGAMHMGDQVNKIKKGRLCNGNEIVHPEMVYVTVHGEIGMFSKIPEKWEIVEAIEDAISELVVHPLDLKPKQYRMFVNERARHEKTGIIDGDLVQQFLLFDQAEKQKIAKSVGMDVAAVQELVEQLSILH